MSFESAVYRLVAESANPNCVAICKAPWCAAITYGLFQYSRAVTARSAKRRRRVNPAKLKCWKPPYILADWRDSEIPEGEPD